MLSPTEIPHQRMRFFFPSIVFHRPPCLAVWVCVVAGRAWRRRTNAIHADFNLRTHDLVPSVDAPDEPPATLEAAGAAEWMREGGRGREVCLEGFALSGGRGLR